MKTHALKKSNLCPSLRSRGSAFTLIELLVVIAVILILAGITFKIMGSVGNKAARARSIWKMEQVKNALSAYYAVNGFYPPGDTYNTNSIYASDKNFIGKGIPPEHPLCETDGTFFDAGVTNKYSTAVDNVTSMGMPYYLFADPQASKWASYLNGVIGMQRFTPTNTTYSGGQPTPAGSVNNSYVRFFDEWDRSFHYVCSSNNNYQNYRLWSYGPDNKNNTSDDVGDGWQE